MSQNSTHHGGAWKVAYADFVTAMMALFMVLWLTSSEAIDKKELAKFFQDPYNTPMDKSMGVLNNEGSNGANTEGSDEGRTKISDVKILHDMAQELMKLLNVDSVNPTGDPIEIEVTSDGLRVTLYDRDSHPLFVEDSAEYTDWGKFVIEQMAWLLPRHGFMIRIDGHVAGGYEGKGLRYTAWDLSSDRAQGARRLMQYYGVLEEQFSMVTAHGMRDPLPLVHPTDESNDRVSISLVLSEIFNEYDVTHEAAH